MLPLRLLQSAASSGNGGKGGHGSGSNAAAAATAAYAASSGNGGKGGHGSGGDAAAAAAAASAASKGSEKKEEKDNHKYVDIAMPEWFNYEADKIMVDMINKGKETEYVIKVVKTDGKTSPILENRISRRGNKHIDFTLPIGTVRRVTCVLSKKSLISSAKCAKTLSRLSTSTHRAGMQIPMHGSSDKDDACWLGPWQILAKDDNDHNTWAKDKMIMTIIHLWREEMMKDMEWKEEAINMEGKEI
ncbi:hypothetical protein EVAR_22229_1 [Eumeta japonica]|uniref:Uncharacterized protein n=1 Tax=Eumeta variegata TaxID=151549 RepID=A0A4C1UAG9_EUMVA|nr:hypothetical protein EVAR_22229_1 [Eumeta japonica]